MGYWRAGPRLPDEYTKDWDYPEISNERAFWMMGHESGYRACQFDYGLDDFNSDGEVGPKEGPNEFERLKQENTALRGLLEANVRVIKAELARELGYGDQLQKQDAEGREGRTEEPPGSGGQDGSGTASPGEQQQGRGLRSVQAHSIAPQDIEQEDPPQQASVTAGQAGSH